MSTPSRRRYTIITIAYQYLGVALGMVIGIFLIPVYLHYIPVATYGLWLATGNVLMWISLVDPGLAYVLQQQVAKAYGERNLPRVGMICGTGILMNLVLVGLFLLAALVMSWKLSWLVAAPNSAVATELYRAFILAALGGTLNLLSFVFRCSNQALHAAIPVGAIDLSVRVTGVFVVLLALRRGFGLESFGLLTLWSGLLNSAGNGICLWILIRRRGICLGSSRIVAKELGGLVSFNFVGRIANLVQTFDLLVANKVLGPEVTAIYGLTRRVPDFLRPLVSLPIESAGPPLSHLFGQGDVEKLQSVVRRLANLSLWATGLAASACFALNGDFVRLWVGSRLFAGTTINFLVSLQMAVFMIISGFSSLCFYLGDIKQLNLVAFVRSFLLFVFVLVGARIGGLIGVAVGGLLAMLVLVHYPVLSTIRRARFSRADARILLREGIAVVVATSVSACITLMLSITGWSLFVFGSVLDVATYAAVLAAVSPGFSVAFQELFQRLTAGQWKRNPAV